MSVSLHGNGQSISSKVKKDVQFEWRLSGLLKDTSFTVRLYYDKIGRNVDKLMSTDNNGNDHEQIKLVYNKHAKVDGVFVDKIGGTCQVSIPSAVCKFTISKADYSFSGKYIFHYFHLPHGNGGYVTTNSSIQLNIVGKK